MPWYFMGGYVQGSLTTWPGVIVRFDQHWLRVYGFPASYMRVRKGSPRPSILVHWKDRGGMILDPRPEGESEWVELSPGPKLKSVIQDLVANGWEVEVTATQEQMDRYCDRTRWWLGVAAFLLCPPFALIYLVVSSLADLLRWWRGTRAGD